VDIDIRCFRNHISCIRNRQSLYLYGEHSVAQSWLKLFIPTYYIRKYSFFPSIATDCDKIIRCLIHSIYSLFKSFFSWIWEVFWAVAVFRVRQDERRTAGDALFSASRLLWEQKLKSHFKVTDKRAWAIYLNNGMLHSIKLMFWGTEMFPQLCEAALKKLRWITVVAVMGEILL